MGLAALDALWPGGGDKKHSPGCKEGKGAGTARAALRADLRSEHLDHPADEVRAFGGQDSGSAYIRRNAVPVGPSLPDGGLLFSGLGDPPSHRSMRPAAAGPQARAWLVR